MKRQRVDATWHYCADAKCRSLLPSYMLFCFQHWAALPVEARQRVNRAATRYLRRAKHGTVQERRDTLEELGNARREVLAVYEATVGPVDTSGVLRKPVTA